jgi:hypothetical protein
MPYSLTLKDENARAVKTGRLKLIDAGYPSRLIGRNSGNGRSVNTTTGTEEDLAQYSIDVNVKDYLEYATDEELVALGIYDRETLQQVIDAQIENEETIANLWKQIEEAKEKIFASTDAEIISSYTSVEENSRAYSTGGHLLQSWYNKIGWSRPSVSTLWCVPFVGYFITLGGGSNSGYSSVPLTNNESANKITLYRSFENKLGDGGSTLWALDDALRSLTKYQLHWYVGISSGIWDNIDSHLRNKGLPAVSFRCAYNIIGSGHARAIYGTYSETEKLNWYFWFFGWHYAYSTYPTTKWYRMYDNGEEGFAHGFYEKAGQYFQITWGEVYYK